MGSLIEAMEFTSHKGGASAVFPCPLSYLSYTFKKVFQCLTVNATCLLSSLCVIVNYCPLPLPPAKFSRISSSFLKVEKQTLQSTRYIPECISLVSLESVFGSHSALRYVFFIATKTKIFATR